MPTAALPMEPAIGLPVYVARLQLFAVSPEMHSKARANRRLRKAISASPFKAIELSGFRHVSQPAVMVRCKKVQHMSGLPHDWAGDFANGEIGLVLPKAHRITCD